MLFDKQNRYSIRKLTIGAASVLIGVFWLSTTSNTAQAAKSNGNDAAMEEKTTTKNAADLIKDSQRTLLAKEKAQNSTTSSTDSAKSIAGSVNEKRSETDISDSKNTTERTSNSLKNNNVVVDGNHAFKNAPVNSQEHKLGTPTVQAQDLKKRTTSVMTSEDGTEQTRTVTVHYKIADGTTEGSKAADDAVLDIYYKRTKTTNSDGQDTYGNWTWDQSRGDEKHKGYHVVSGNWTYLPKNSEDFNAVTAEAPEKEGYTLDTSGDGTSSVPANKFVAPTYTGNDTSKAGESSVAYTKSAEKYEAKPEHTVWYIPVKHETRTVTEYYKYEDGTTAHDPDQIQVFYKGTGVRDKTTNKVTYTWTWDSSAGDEDTPGFHVISGNWSVGSKGKPITGPWSVTTPTISGYTPITTTGIQYTSNNFGHPTSGDQFTRTDAKDWFYRSSNTTYYVPSENTGTKYVYRYINIIKPGGSKTTNNQYTTCTSNAYLNSDDSGVVYRGTNGTMSAVDVSISGYTPIITQTIDGKTTTINSIDAITVDGKSSNITINVTYIDSNSRVGKISYVDSTTGTEVGNAPISGKIGSTISITDTINKNVPKDYEIASGQNIPKTVTVTDSGIETVVVKVEKTATGKISYVDSTTNKEVGSATITGKVGHTISIIDTVNNNIPKDYELVPGQTIPTVDVTENGISTVNIKVQKKTVTGKISYIDVDANDKEVQTTDLSAKAGETVRISTSIPENYELVSDQNIPTEVTATSSGIPTVTVKIKHKTQDVSDTDPGAHQARTITEYYKYADAGSLTGQEVFSEDQLQVFYKGTAIKDLVTGKVTYSNWKWDTSQGDEDTPGFHVVKGTWTGLGEKGKPSTKSIVINPPDKEEYTAITGTRVNYNTNVFVNPNTSPNTDFTTDTASKWYYRNSLTTYYVPKTLVDKMISRTIYVTEPGKEQASVTNNVNVTRYAAINSTDTGVIYEGFEGSGWQITGTNSWPAYTVPSHPGYTVKITKSIDGGAEEAGSEADLAQKTVTVDGKSEVINITYSATSTISLDGSGSSEYTGQPITIDDVNKGITVNVIGPDSTTSGKYTLVDGDVEFLKDGSTGSYSTTLPTDAGKYSMKLTEAGMNHIKTKFGNNAITFQYADNKDVAYYTIAQVKAEVSLTGSKTITYGDAVKIDASNYQLKATDSQGNSIDTTGIKLTDGDLEFVTTPTDAGTYQVKLTTQGIDKLKALKGAANYNWDSASDARANYIVEKKSLVYSILGIVNSQYTGSPITIADLTSHGSIIHVQVQSNDYALVDGDVQFAKHGTHDYSTIYPTEIGRYDVQLTEAGVRHLQEKYGDRNTKLTPVKQEQVATYIIEQGTAKVSLSGDQTVAYNEDKTIDPSKYTLSIKNSNGDTIFANETLAAGDLEFVNTPTEPGNYQVKLSQQGIAKLKALSDSYNWDSASEARANYQATGATSKINLINNVSVPYTGNPVTFDEIGSRVKVNIAGPDNATSGTYNLVAGDIQIAKAGTSDFSTTYPTEAGQYVVKLTEAGLKHIKNHFGNNYITYQYNENIPHSDWTTLTIEQAKANVSLTGGQSSYYSQEAKIDAGKYQVSIKDDQGNALFAGKITLADGDLEFDTTPTNVGTYQVKLTSQGLNKVKALSTNYSWDSAAKATATYTVEAMPVNVTVEGGNKSVKYGSQDWVDNFIDDPKTPEDIGYTLSLKTKDGKDLDTSSVSGNLTWQNDTTPTNAGEYHLSVDTSAIQQKLGSNYQVIDKVDNSLTFTIEKGNATITLVNKYDDGKTYDGQDGTIDATNYTYTVITDGADPDRIYSINDFSTVDNIELTDDYLQLVPINGNIKDAGTYEVKLTSAGEQAIKNTDASDDLTTGTTLYGSNYNWTFAPSEATYKIAKTTAMATVNGQVSKTYDGTAISNYTPSVDINVSGVGDTTNNIELTAGTDYVWKLGNQTFTTAPVNTGDYTIELTDSGKNKIMAFDANNVDWDDAGSSITSAATYTITQAAASATLSGQGTRAYNGQGVTLADLNAKDANNNITLTIKYPANGDANHSETIALTADDFVWNTTDGKAPVDANSQAYTISLNTAAIKKLIEDKAGYSTDASGKKISNVTVNDTAVSGTAEYTITPLETAAIVAGYGDYGKEYDATTTDSIDPSKLKFTAKVGDQTVDLDTTGLTGDDFEWVDQNGAALT